MIPRNTLKSGVPTGIRTPVAAVKGPHNTRTDNGLWRKCAIGPARTAHQNTLRRRLIRRANYFLSRMVATHGGTTPRARAAHTQARNCAMSALRMLEAVNAGRGMLDVRMDLEDRGAL